MKLNLQNMRFPLFILLIGFIFSSHAQTITLVSTLEGGLRDTVRFGFVQGATIGEDISLGELNMFTTPVSGFEGRVLQRDTSNFECAYLSNGSEVYYSNNFDSKTNYRDHADTSIENKLFEIWFSDNQTDSVELISDIPLKSFLIETQANFYVNDCEGPVGVLEIKNDTIKHIKFDLLPNLGITQIIFALNPSIILSSYGNEIENDLNFKIFPNPTTGSFSIHSKKAEQIQRILIYNSYGILIEHFTYNPSISDYTLNNYSSGCYIIVIELKNGIRHTKKIVKQ